MKIIDLESITEFQEFPPLSYTHESATKTFMGEDCDQIVHGWWCTRPRDGHKVHLAATLDDDVVAAWPDGYED